MFGQSVEVERSAASHRGRDGAASSGNAAAWTACGAVALALACFQQGTSVEGLVGHGCSGIFVCGRGLESEQKREGGRLKSPAHLQAFSMGGVRRCTDGERTMFEAQGPRANLGRFPEEQLSQETGFVGNNTKIPALGEKKRREPRTAEHASD